MDIIFIFVGFIFFGDVKQKPEIRQCLQATSDVLALQESYASKGRSYVSCISLIELLSRARCLGL